MSSFDKGTSHPSVQQLRPYYPPDIRPMLTEEFYQQFKPSEVNSVEHIDINLNKSLVLAAPTDYCAPIILCATSSQCNVDRNFLQTV